MKLFTSTIVALSVIASAAANEARARRRLGVGVVGDEFEEFEFDSDASMSLSMSFTFLSPANEAAPPFFCADENKRAVCDGVSGSKSGKSDVSYSFVC
jgi:hypothetical protein